MNTAMKYALPEGGAAGTKAIWVGRILSALAIAFFVMDGVMKLIQPQVVIDATRQIGWPENRWCRFSRVGTLWNPPQPFCRTR
jgi:hypothetical protein